MAVIFFLTIPHSTESAALPADTADPTESGRKSDQGSEKQMREENRNHLSDLFIGQIGTVKIQIQKEEITNCIAYYILAIILPIKILS